MQIGYVRLSKNDSSQAFGLQLDALEEAGVDPERIYKDQASRKKDIEIAEYIFTRQD